MIKLNLKVVVKRQKCHSYLGEAWAVADNALEQNFTASKPNQKWTADILQFNCSIGKTNLSPILDMGMGTLWYGT